MPKRYWLCAFCSETYLTYNPAELHEEECCFNPKNRGCFSCGNYVSQGFNSFGCDECKVFKNNHELLEDYFPNEKLNCPLWVEEE